MAGSSQEEVRIDLDGSMYTEAGFSKWYGLKMGPRRWMAARVHRESPPPAFPPGFNRGVDQALQEAYDFAQQPGHARVRWRWCQLMKMFYCLHLLPDGKLLLRDAPPVEEPWEEIF